MSRVQVLDVGDRVYVPIEGEFGVVVSVDESTGICFEDADEREVRYFNRVDRIERVNGDIQVGDFVRINRLGTAVEGLKGVVVVEGEEGYGVFTFGLGSVTVLPNELTRITRAEALA